MHPGALRHDHAEGLQHDIDVLMRQVAERRRTLRWLAAGSLAPLAMLGCGGSSDDSGTNPGTSGTTDTTGGSSGSTTSDTTTGGGSGTGSTGNTTTEATCAAVPEETAGPYPGDGSNTNAGGIVNALTLTGIVRSDIRTSVAGASGTAPGVPLTLRLQLINSAGQCAALSGYAIYLWHCTRDGLYSLYSAGVTDENFLRGVQETDGSGAATFTTIVPGCYDGRMPHMHFEVFRSLATATGSTGKIRTSQIAFPTQTIAQVYETSGYETSARNLTRISFSTDNVFRDGTELQMATLEGSATSGYTSTLTVGVAA